MPREAVHRAYGERIAGELDFIVQTLDELLLVVDRGKDALVDDVLLQRAVEGCANRIGDMIRDKIPETLQDEYNGRTYWSAWVNWRVMLMHHYHRMDIDLLWRDMARDVPEFRRFLIEDVLS
jgi:uncharacterized protein with HEPN domain